MAGDISDKNHWQGVYEDKGADEVSWFRSHLEHSLSFIRSCGLPASARIIDVGGGASTLVDDLLSDGYTNLAVIDLSSAALEVSRKRIGDKADSVDWIVGDATEPFSPAHSVDFWHDRAVFHFLTTPAARSAYLVQVSRTLRPGGHVVVATFGRDGPEQCSGLPVHRYDASEIHALFGDEFEKIGEATEQHSTPWGATQSFVYCFCQRKP